MTAEEFFVDYLGTILTVPVSGDVPTELPEKFVTVEQTGSRSENHLYHPTIAVQSWAGSRAEAAKLNEEVKTAMAGAIVRPEISRCHLNSDYNFPDLDRKIPRYQALFDITYLD